MYRREKHKRELRKLLSSVSIFFFLILPAMMIDF